MQTKPKQTLRSTLIPSIITFLGIFIVLMVIGLLNAPTKGGPQVMKSISNYLTEVRATALPFIAAIAVIAVVIGYLAARTLAKVWNNDRIRRETLAAYTFIA